MTLPPIPSQDDLLYTNVWNEDMDRLLIDTLISQKQEGNWTEGDGNYHALLIARSVINSEYNSNLQLDDMTERMCFLQKRHNMFSSLCETPDVWWDETSNKVSASRPQWEHLFSLDPLYMAYFRQGDPLVYQMKLLFRRDPLATPNEVIVISDGTYSSHVNRNKPIILDSDEDEVVSPIMMHKSSRPTQFIE